MAKGWTFNDTFAAQEAALRAGMKQATKDTAKKAKKRAQDNAPVRTGQLRDSAQVNDAYNKQLGVAETSVDFTAPYAGLVHNGGMGEIDEDGKSTGFRRPQPFLRDGLDASEEDLVVEATKILIALGARRVRRYE